MPKLIVLNEPDKAYEFDEGSILIGRAPECQICIQSNGVSRQHARLALTDEGWLLEDLESHNGLFLHNVRIKSTILRHTTVFRVGNVYVRFEQEISQGELAEISGQLNSGIESFCKVIGWQKEVGISLLTAAIAGCNVLLDGVEEELKEQMARACADIFKLEWRLISLTSDTLPEDILGREIFVRDGESGSFSLQFAEGPIFTNLLFARGIDHAKGRVQAALLDACKIGRVHVGEEKLPLPSPRILVATINSSKQERESMLSPLMLENFALSVKIESPSPAEEEAWACRENSYDKGIINVEKLLDLQELLLNMPVAENVLQYAGKIVRGTRPENEEAPDFIKKSIQRGAGIGALKDLLLCAKAKALLDGRFELIWNDIHAMAIPVLRHRIGFVPSDNDAQSSDAIIRRLLVTIQP